MARKDDNSGKGATPYQRTPGKFQKWIQGGGRIGPGTSTTKRGRGGYAPKLPKKGR